MNRFLVPSEQKSPTIRRPQDVRPSTFHQDVEERTHEPQVEYPIDESPTISGPQDGPVAHGELQVHPAPVYMVEAPPVDVQFTDWAPNTLTVNGQPTQIADSRRHRTRLVVRNLDAVNPVYLTRSAASNDPTGAYLLPAGQTQLFEHNGPVYAFAAVGIQVSISLFSEFNLEDRDS